MAFNNSLSISLMVLLMLLLFFICGCSHSHQFKENIVLPTCLTEGYTEHKCKHCGVTYKDTYTTALGHTFSHYISNGNGTGTSKCDRCDETHTIIYGDVNSDGKVNAQDRVYLTRYIARWDGYDINPLTSDVNCDEKINAQDRLILARHLARWQGYEELPYLNGVINNPVDTPIN